LIQTPVWGVEGARPEIFYLRECIVVVEVPVKQDGSSVLRFYAGVQPDHQGRLLREIQQWPDDQLERTHDYIQWLFPLNEPSGFNIDAPILNDEAISRFRGNSSLRRGLQTSLIVMLAFYGLEMRGTVPLSVTRASSFTERAENWVTPSNHNHLRITRILKSLRLLGLEAEAAAFFECLADIHHGEAQKAQPGISAETLTFWQAALMNYSDNG
jgi:hypothetical protein